MLGSRAAAIFSGEEKPANVNTMENHFARILEKKRRIVEEVKHRIDLYDQHLATKCLLEGVKPPSWLFPPFIPPITSELDKKKIVSGLLFSQARPSIQQRDCVLSDIVAREDLTSAVCKPSFQQRDSVVEDTLVRGDLTSSINKPLEEQLLEERDTVGSVLNHSQEQVENIASLGDVNVVEGLPENVLTGCGENQSCPSLEYSQNQGVKNSVDATSPGHIQGEMVAKSFSTASCERKPSSRGYCHDETEPNTCLDPELSLVQIQRSKSRQKALELRSSAKASKSRSSGNIRNELKPSPSGNIGLGIASLRSDSFSEIKLFQQDENDEECGDEVENSNFEGEGEDQCTKFSLTTDFSTPCQKTDSVQKSLGGETHASAVLESPIESGHLNEIDILQSTETVDEVSAKKDEQVDDPQSRSCNETAYIDGTSSKSSDQFTRFSLTADFSTPCQKMDSVQKSLGGETYASAVPESPIESDHLNEIVILQSTETIDKVSAKEDEQVDDPQSRSCNETAYPDGTSSKSLGPDTLQSIEAIDEVSAKVDDPRSSSCNETAYLTGGTSSKSLSQDSFKREHQYDVDIQKMLGSASTDHYEVELQKMIESASSAELRFQEGYLIKEAGLMSPASLSFRPEQLSVQRSLIAPDQGFVSGNLDDLPIFGETSHLLASRVVGDSDCSPCLSPLGLIGSDDGSPAVLEGFIIQTDDENQSDFKSQIKCDSFQLPRTAAESATLIEQICKSSCRTTPSLHLTKSLKFNDELDLDQSVSAGLFDVMFSCQNLEGSFDKTVTKHDYSGISYTDYLPFSGAGSYADARNPHKSPTEKLWYRSLQKSSSSEKRGSHISDLPCISEENENVNEEAEHLCTENTKSMSSEQGGSSLLELPCVPEENENRDEISKALNEAFDSNKENISAERKPHGNLIEDSVKFPASVSKSVVPVDRQSLDSVSTAFCFSAKCNDSHKSKVVRQKGGSRRFTGKGQENQGRTDAGKHGKPPSSRFSKAKLSCSSSLRNLRPRLSDKQPRHNNIVSNITSFVPLVQQQKRAAAVITGKREVKVKSLEAAEAVKRIAEQKENDRKMKKEAMKLERARLEQENLRKQEIENKKKEEEQKKKEAEMALKQEMEKKKNEEKRKRKELEMADRKRQREEEGKKLKEAAKRQRIAETQRQQREADQKLQAEKELKRQAMDARIKAQKELKEDQVHAEKTREQTNNRKPEMTSKSISSNDTNSSRPSSDELKVLSNQGKMSEESYDISPYKHSDDEEEDEDDNDDISNNKFVPIWARKSNVLINVISQQNLDSDLNFPARSFRAINQIVLPRKLKLLNSDAHRN